MGSLPQRMDVGWRHVPPLSCVQHASMHTPALSPGCLALRGVGDPAARELSLAPGAGLAMLAMAPSALEVFGWSKGSNRVVWVAPQAG